MNEHPSAENQHTTPPAPEDILRSEQEARGQPTVREQLVDALGERSRAFHEAEVKMGCYTANSFEDCDTTGCVDARLALDRARAEPEEHCGHDGPDCPTWQAGHDEGHSEGLEAQRERVGGGAA